MPDFSVNVVRNAPTVDTVVWTDPASETAPTRINPAEVSPRYWRVELGATIEFRAVVAGVEAPADPALDSRLINWAWVEGPFEGLASPPPIVTPVGGKTAVAQVDTTGAELGHYTIQAWRADGGAVLVPFEVEET